MHPREENCSSLQKQIFSSVKIGIFLEKTAGKLLI